MSGSGAAVPMAEQRQRFGATRAPELAAAGGRPGGSIGALILDAGVLASVDRDEERARVFLTAAKRAGEPLHTSAAVVAEVWRDGARQARLASFSRASRSTPSTTVALWVSCSHAAAPVM